MKQGRLSLFSDAFACAASGIRDGFSLRLISFSVGLWVGSLALWSLILFFALGAVKAVAGFLAAWVLLGVFVIFPHLLPAGPRAKLTGVPLSVGAEALLGQVFVAATWIALVLLIFVLVVVTVRIAIEFALMPVVRRVVLKRYPPFPKLPSTGLLAPIKNVTKTILLIIFVGGPCLLIPVANVVLVFVLFGYLNVRTLVNEALDELATPTEQRAVIRDGRGTMILLGSVYGAIQLIPLIGFLSPAWIAAGTCHLCLRELQRVRLRAETQPPALLRAPSSTNEIQ